LQRDPLAAGRLYRLDHLGGGVRIALEVDCDVIALPGRQPRGGGADAAAAAGDEKDGHDQLSSDTRRGWSTVRPVCATGQRGKNKSRWPQAGSSQPTPAAGWRRARRWRAAPSRSPAQCAAHAGGPPAADAGSGSARTSARPARTRRPLRSKATAPAGKDRKRRDSTALEI